MSNNLYEALKAKDAGVKAEQNEEVKLDDVTRVKVLSPGRQVFKRFVRNRLAVFGSVALIILFLFSFVGPIFYPYGQKQIFRKYDERNVNYALAKENTAYNGYVLNSDISLSTEVRTKMNSNIKSMLSSGETERYIFEGGESFLIERVSDEIFNVGPMEMSEVCTVGHSKVKLGTYNSVIKAFAYENGIEEIPGLEAAAKKNCKGKSGEFTLAGVKYTFVTGQVKSFDVFCEFDGINYVGDAESEEFESKLNSAVESDASEFEFSGDTYVLVKDGDNRICYALGEYTPAMVYTRYVLAARTNGLTFSDEFRVGALSAAFGSGKFTADGTDYTVADEDGLLVIRTAADGAEYAELTTFSVRRYSGEDSVDYDLKKKIEELASEMTAAGEKVTSFTYQLPEQNEAGEYVYDENGELSYVDSDITMTQRETGEYVLNCTQVIYVIDMYAAPSRSHILGTDGDGFDVLARVMYGGRISLMVGFVVVFLETFLGVIMGGLAGYYGGWVDNIIMRLVDIFYCLPSLPIMIIIGAAMDAVRMNTYLRLLIMMAALGIMGWAGVARLVRGQILSLREQEFMVAAEATGIKVKSRIFHHLVPNVMPQLIVSATMGMGGVIIEESTLSFLGLGVKHPLATWGTMINSVSSASAMAHYPFIWIPVGLLICFTVIAFNFVGDGLRDAYDPKAKR